MSIIFLFLAVFVPLVFFHEFGHFIMAKLGGIHVTKFAFGFGKKLFGFTYKGTDYRWNLLPLGGYVDFMGDALYTYEIPDDASHFYNRPKWIRFLVLVMGPVFNLILAFAVFWIYYVAVNVQMDPVEDGKPFTVGFVMEGSPEWEAGLRADDRIAAINGVPVVESQQVTEHLFFYRNQETTFQVERGGETLEITFVVEEVPGEGVGVATNIEERYLCQIHNVQEGSPAERGGLKTGDVLIAVNDHPIAFRSQATLDFIQAQFSANAPGSSTMTVLRDEQEHKITVTPEKQEDRWIAGFIPGPRGEVVKVSPVEAFGRSWDACVQNSTLIFKGLRHLVTGNISVRAMSSPIGVAKAAKDFWDYSPAALLFLMAVLSLNLGILNLLPIPVLDGGEIFVLLVEWISRKDFNIATKMQIKFVGLIFLAGLMGVVIISDIMKWLPSPPI